jgi:hypothetical protein
MPDAALVPQIPPVPPDSVASERVRLVGARQRRQPFG